MLERSYVTIDGEQVQWDEETMNFLNIEEDGLQGYDIVTFEYEGKEYKSYIINK